MARLLPPPVNQADIVLSSEGVWLHPEIELVEAVADRVELGAGEYEPGSQLPPEWNGWLLYKLQETSERLMSWWAREYIDAPDLALKPRQSAPRMG